MNLNLLLLRVSDHFCFTTLGAIRWFCRSSTEPNPWVLLSGHPSPGSGGQPPRSDSRTTGNAAAEGGGSITGAARVNKGLRSLGSSLWFSSSFISLTCCCSPDVYKLSSVVNSKLNALCKSLTFFLFFIFHFLSPPFSGVLRLFSVVTVTSSYVVCLGAD